MDVLIYVTKAIERVLCKEFFTGVVKRNFWSDDHIKAERQSGDLITS